MTPTTEAGRALLATERGDDDLAMYRHLSKEPNETWDMDEAIIAIEREAVAAALKGLREEVADCPRDDEGGIWLEDVYALIDARLAALDA